MGWWPALEVSFNDAATDLFQAALLDYHIAAIDETAPAWRVFFTTAADRDAASSRLARQFPDLTFQRLDVPDEDWAARSQAGLRAIQIGDIIVAPPWDIPSEVRLRPDTTHATVIVIQPSMGFGTGHHATTRLCLAALQQLDLRGRSVLDAGTGSGVLAIAASRLGAATVAAIDDDPDAIRAACENVGLNPGADVVVQAADLRSASLTRSDVVIANLTGALLIQAASRLLDVRAPAGHLILSGFMKPEERDVCAAYAGLAVTARAQEDEWLCVTLRARATA